MIPISAALLAATVLLASPALSAPKPDPALNAQALDILRQGIAFRTVAGGDQMVPYAEYLKGVLVAGGYKPDEIVSSPWPAPRS